MTDSSQYRLSAEEADRWKRTKEKAEESARLRREKMYSAPIPAADDASQLVDDKRETLKSLSLRVWRLEDELEECRAANGELRQRVVDLSEMVAELAVRLPVREVEDEEEEKKVAPVTPVTHEKKVQETQHTEWRGKATTRLW